MSRIVYVNGEFLPEEEAKISVFDRGFLFADGVYEVSSVLRGKMVDNGGHLQRLARSLGELKMDAPCSNQEIEDIQYEVIRRNELEEGMLYLQVTRGAPADRGDAHRGAEEGAEEDAAEEEGGVEAGSAGGRSASGGAEAGSADDAGGGRQHAVC